MKRDKCIIIIKFCRLRMAILYRDGVKMKGDKIGIKYYIIMCIIMKWSPNHSAII